jgi:hypothetical protein
MFIFDSNLGGALSSAPPVSTLQVPQPNLSNELESGTHSKGFVGLFLKCQPCELSLTEGHLTSPGRKGMVSLW